MNVIFYYILHLVEFIFVISCGIAIVSFIFYYLSSNFNIKFINIYGFLTNMDDFSLIMLSCAILKEISLIYCIVKLSDSSYLYLYIFFMLCFTYSFFSFNVLTFVKEIIISTIEYFILFFLNLLTAFMIEVRQSAMVKYYIIILSAILIACSVYFFAKNLDYIAKRDKNVRRNLIAR